MATTNDDQLVERLVPKVLSSIRAKSVAVESVDIKSDLEGITSIPCYDTSGEQFKAVLVSVNALKEPAAEAGAIAQEAAAAANEAAERADAATERVTDSITDITAEKQMAQEAAAAANEAAQTANSVAETVTLAEAERVAAETARVEAENTRTEEFASRMEAVAEATESANDTADHPTYVGEDNYVYRWNKEARSYDKTDVYVRGEGFSISKVYNSIVEMEADTEHGLKEGDFVLINTGDVENPDNAQLYTVNADGGFRFLVDMSGAIGFTGKTPQLYIGTVSVGSGKSSAAVTLTSAGFDISGNPEYDINYVIPCLAYEDLTQDQIAELQRPASEMIAILTATNDSVTAAEQSRVEAENARAETESERVESEAARISAEEGRSEAESSRAASEQERALSEADRKAAESARETAEQGRVQEESYRVEEFSRLKGESETATEAALAATEAALAVTKIVEVSEDEYSSMEESGTLDSTKLYFVYEQ